MATSWTWLSRRALGGGCRRQQGHEWGPSGLITNFKEDAIFLHWTYKAPRAPCQTSQPVSHAQVLCGGFASVSKFPIAGELCLGRHRKKEEEYFVLKYKIKVNLILVQERKENHTKKWGEWKFLQRIILRGLNQTLSSPQLIFKMLCHLSHSRTPCPSVGSLTWTKPSTGSGDQSPAECQPGLLPTGEGWTIRGMPDFQPVSRLGVLTPQPFLVPFRHRLEGRLPLSAACLR